MKKSEVIDSISRFVKEFSGLDFLSDKAGILDEVAGKIYKLVNTEKDVRDYLDFVMNAIDDLNGLFAKEGKRPIPYSRILNFAKNDTRIANFTFSKGMKKKRDGEVPVGMAGINSPEEQVDNSDISYDGVPYEELVVIGNLRFFFSPFSRKVIVHNGKKMMSYADYYKPLKKKNKKYIKKGDLIKEIKNQDISSDVAISYDIYIRQVRAKIKRKHGRERLCMEKG